MNRIIIQEGDRLGEVWTPSMIGSNLNAWFDASDLSTITTETGVSQLDDKSGNNQHLIQGSAASQPRTEIRSLNGLNVLDFDGIDDSIGLESVFNLTNSGNLQVIGLWIVDSVDNSNDSLWSYSTSTVHLQYRSNNALQFKGQFRVTGTSNRNVDAPISKSPLVISEPYIISCICDYTTNLNNQFIDSVEAIDSSRDYVTQIPPSGDFRIFNNAVYTEGAFAEIIITEDVSNITREKIEGYLAWKWGLVSKLPSSHPYKNNGSLFGY